MRSSFSINDIISTLLVHSSFRLVHIWSVRIPTTSNEYALFTLFTAQDDARMKHFTAALKEKKLLYNFFKRVKPNTTGTEPVHHI